MLRTLFLTLALLAPLGVAAQTGDPVTGFSLEDGEMNAAMAEAGRTLPLFLTNVTDAEGYGPPSGAVKVAFPTSDGAEIIWVSPFLWDGTDNMAGLLANQPNYLGDLAAGDVVEFSTDMVRDWSLIAEDGTMYGNYTTRVMLPSLDAATAASLSASLSPAPVPAQWSE